MMNIYYLQDHLEYLDEVVELEYEEWANEPDRNREERLQKKKDKILSLLSNPSFCKLILLCDHELIGFISLFPNDLEEEPTLTPWYATMYVKKEYRGKGYSKILNDALLEEARKRGFHTIYLKTTLNHYYEKYGAIYIKNIDKEEKLYKFVL